MNKPNAQAIIARVLEETKRRGASFTEVSFSQGRGSLDRIWDGQVYQPTAGEGMTISISAVIDGKRVNAGCDSERAIDGTIEGMFRAARLLPKTEEPFVPQGAYPIASLPPEATFDPWAAELGDDRLTEIVGRVNGILEPAGFVFDGVVSHHVNEFTFANSAGTFQSAKVTKAQLVVFGFDANNRSISAYRSVAGKSLAQFPVEEIAHSVAERLAIQKKYLASHGGRRIDPFGGSSGPKRFDVIFEPSCWAGLLAVFSGAWNGKDYHDGTSFFSGKLGERVMGENITIWDDPLNVFGVPEAFDDEGYPTKKLLLVEKGIARNVVYDNAMAKRIPERLARKFAEENGVAYNDALVRKLAEEHGIRPTGHALPPAWRYYGAAPGHLVVEGGTSTIEDMIKASKKPTLLVTTLRYIRQTHQQDGRETGTTLHGMYLVENGEIVGPTKRLRFDESIPEALSRVTHIGPSVPTLSMETEDTPQIVPPMRSEGFMIRECLD